MSSVSIPRLTSWGPIRVYLRDWTLFRRMWFSVLVGSIVQPLMFLLGVGLGVGELVDRGPEATDVLGDTSYFAFYAAAMLATTAMFVVSQEAMWPTMDGFSWSHAYDAMLATPLDPIDVVAGKMLHFAVRALATSGGVAVVLALFAETRTLGLIPAAFVGMLTGLAFGVPISAWTASRSMESSFPAILRFGVIPMFLFGGAFYPIEQLPTALQAVAWVTPLWHGVELCRGLVLGGLSVGAALVHLGVLFAYIGVGCALASVTFRKRLRF